MFYTPRIDIIPDFSPTLVKVFSSNFWKYFSVIFSFSVTMLVLPVSLYNKKALKCFYFLSFMYTKPCIMYVKALCNLKE